MKRTLLAFGDSHTAGAEILERYSYECFDRSYASYVAKYYKFGYENFSKAGCGNDWLLKKFNERIKTIVENKEKVFVLFNFCESSRTFFEDKGKLTVHFYPRLLDNNHFKKVEKSFILRGEEDTEYFQDMKRLRKTYFQYLKDNDIDQLDKKSLYQVEYIQKICLRYNIPFIFHSSCQWYNGSWDSILEKNYYGLDKNNKDLDFLHRNYSFWGVATNSLKWRHLRTQERWKEHYPEEYHRHYASRLAHFINEQKILEDCQ